MTMDLEKIVVVILLPIIGGLLGWRGASKVKNDNAAEARESRHESGIHKERNDAVRHASELQDQIVGLKNAAVGQHAEILRLRQLDKDKTRMLKRLVELLEAADERSARDARRWIGESALAPLDGLPPAPPSPPRLPRR